MVWIPRMKRVGPFQYREVLWPVVRPDPVIQQEEDLALAAPTMSPAPLVEPMEHSPDSLDDR